MMKEVGIVSFLVVVSALDVSGQMECYRCSSSVDSRCGETFGFTEKDAVKIVETCSEEAVSCRKLISDDVAYSKLVVRGCFNRTFMVTPPPKDICYEMVNSESCYCLTSKCNGQAKMQITLGIIGAGIALSFWMTRCLIQ